MDYDLLLYDVTSTYFEGLCEGNSQAQRGYSRDKRSDCKQVCIGLVVTREGIPLGYEVFAGNRNDVTTWQEIVTTMERRYGRANRILCRTNVMDWSAEDLWQAYIQLTDAEAAFRIHKSDLRIRPVWHQTEERVQAHILVCFLAYVLWKMLHQMTRAAGLGDEPRRIFEELGKIRLVDVVLPTREKNIEIRRRCVARPTDHQAILLDRLGLSLPRQLKVESPV